MSNDARTQSPGRSAGLSDDEFREAAHQAIEWIIEYRRALRTQPQPAGLSAEPVAASEQKADASRLPAHLLPLPKATVRCNVEPGYLQALLNQSPPDQPETWDSVMTDLNRAILPGLTHWESPNFFAYFKPHASYPTVLGELLSAGINNMGFSWISSPACTELETLSLNWLAQLLGLPHCFTCPPSTEATPSLSGKPRGGGVIQGSAGEAAVVCMLAAKERALATFSSAERDVASTKLVVYVSDQTHSTLHKACRVVGIPAERLRLLPTKQSDQFALSAATLSEAIKQDQTAGLIPFFVCVTAGTTSSGAIDPIRDIHAAIDFSGQNIWVHVDSAWGGSFAVCPEFRFILDGVELCDSVVINAHKQLLVSFDCACLWVRDRHWLLSALTLQPEKEEYLRNQATDSGAVIDYKDWQIPLGRRFRALKLWMVMKLYGGEGLRAHLRKGVALAQRFEGLVAADSRFDLFTHRAFSLVCFRLRGSNDLNKQLVEKINRSGRAFLISTVLAGEQVLRLAIGGCDQEEHDIDSVWQTLSLAAAELLAA